MANITELLAALSNLPPITGAPPLTPLPAPVNAPTDFILPQTLAGPEVPPPAPSMPLDQNLIARIMATGGAAPTPPPAPAPLGKLDRLALALQAFGAGVQGQGPQFLQSVREERQRPQREYEARQQQYEQQQRQLGLLAVQSAQSQQERQQTREDRAAEMQFNRDFQESMRKMGITDTMAIEKMKEGAQIQRDKERERAMDEKLASQQKAQQEQTARLIARDYGKGGASPSVAKELGDYYAGLRDQVSPEAAKFETTHARLEEARASRQAQLAAGGGRGGAGSSVAAQKAYAQFEAIQQQVVGAQARGDAQEEMALRRQMQAAHNRLARFPGQFDLGYDQTGMPYAKPRTSAAPQPTQPTEGAFQGVGAFPSMLAPGNQSLGPVVGNVQPTQQGGGAPALNKQQRARFNDIKREQPNASDAQIMTYMRKKGWL